MRQFKGTARTMTFNKVIIQRCFSVAVVFSILIAFPIAEGKKCPGKCIYNVTDCKANGGKIAGYCTNELACCDYSYRKIGSCGTYMTKLNTAMFRSPDYPENSQGDLVCQFDFALNSNATGLIVEFTDVLMDGVGFVKHSSCESDMFYLKGFPHWTPPAQCGNLTNYAAVIDLGSKFTKGMKNLTILALMSSPKYRWNIKITQIFQNRKHIPKRLSIATTETPKHGKHHRHDDDDESENSAEADENERPEESEKVEESQNNLESEEEEMFRIIQMTSNNPKVPRISAADETSILGDEGQDDYNNNYPEEEAFIVNGDDIQISTVPWQASLRSVISPRMAKLLPKLKLKNCTIDEGIHFCGGSIISDQHILSATHCFLVGEKLSTWQRTSTMKIVLGDSNLCDENKSGIQEFKVDKVYYHYAYDTYAIMNDVVVIKLDKKIRFTNKIQPIKMADEWMHFENQIAVASGWGLTNLTIEQSASKTPDQLQFADDMLIGNISYCKKEQLRLYPQIKDQSLTKYKKYEDVFSSLICTYVRNGTLPRIVGQGDSGGPLIVNYKKNNKDKSMNNHSKNKWKSEGSSANTEPLLVGVISYMIPIPHEYKEHDVSNYVDFYQNVSYYRKWIDLAMQ